MALQQQQHTTAAALQQRHQLLARLAAAPDISLFKDKCERITQLRNMELPGSEEDLVVCAAAMSNGLQKLQPYLNDGSCQLDLPDKAIFCILWGLLIIFGTISQGLENDPASTKEQQKLQVERVAVTGTSASIML
jgi:hypothetical protein